MTAAVLHVANVMVILVTPVEDVEMIGHGLMEIIMYFKTGNSVNQIVDTGNVHDSFRTVNGGMNHVSLVTLDMDIFAKEMVRLYLSL